MAADTPTAAAGRATAPSGWQVWLLAIRVPTLSAAVVPVLVGTALAARWYGFDPLIFIVVLGAAILIQIGTNLTNDLFDFQKGADTGARLGPVRVVQAGLLSQKQVAAASALTFGLAIVLGLYLVDVGGWPILRDRYCRGSFGSRLHRRSVAAWVSRLGRFVRLRLLRRYSGDRDLLLAVRNYDRRRGSGLASGGDAGDGDPGGQQPARRGDRSRRPASARSPSGWAARRRKSSTLPWCWVLTWSRR